LGSVTDVEQLRLDITMAQGRVGLPAGAAKDGNNRKRQLPGIGAALGAVIIAEAGDITPATSPSPPPPASLSGRLWRCAASLDATASAEVALIETALNTCFC
jgi:hypothetical protein